MATFISTSTVNELVSVNNLGYIKAINVRIDVSDVRPNTKLNAFFDGVKINGYCRQVVSTNVPVNPQYTDITSNPATVSGYSALGAIGELESNDFGEVSIIFFIPAGRFSTGDKQIIVTDSADVAGTTLPGNVYGKATATFASRGVSQTWQSVTTQTTRNVTNVVRYLPYVAGDPLAQSFFTYGESGGVFITRIALYFQSKDPVMPVTLELRKLDRGYPMPFDKSMPEFRVTVKPEFVNISNDGSVPTSFIFDHPVYLPEDGDYCFVVLSQSKMYNLWTSEMGERSIENGSLIFKQPYVGSLFRSENDITWSADQFEDIKFTMYKAVFDTNQTATIKLDGKARFLAISGENVFTTNGSSEVVVKMPYQHGLEVGGKFDIFSFVGGTYNGITAVNLTGTFTATEIIDEFTFKFIAGNAANKTGYIDSSNIVHTVHIVNGGSGYTSKPTITIGAPTSGTTATVSESDITLVDGSIVAIKVTNVGSGYIAQPQITVSGGGGTGLEIIPIVEPTFSVAANRKFSSVTPMVSYSVLDGTSVSTVLNATTPAYGSSGTLAIASTGVSNLGKTYIVASTSNEDNFLSGNDSLSMTMTLSSDNPNVSPIIDMRKMPSILVSNFVINNQSDIENINEATTASTASVSNIVISNGGSGYVIAPVVTIEPAPNDVNTDNIVAATATAVLTGGVVTDITVNTAGSGYTKTPIVRIAAPASGITAIAAAELTAFNSEVATKGTAYSRYLTNTVKLNTASTGIKLLVDAYSTPVTSFDWYIRSSLAVDDTNHADNDWKLLSCDVERDKSSQLGKNELYEYEFYAYDMPEFDTYDLKCVLRSTDETVTPFIKRYRAIVVV